MLVLHAVWCGDTEAPVMRLWAESGALLETAAAPRRASARKAPLHPFAAPGKDLRGRLEASAGKAGEAAVWLPTADLPLPSDLLAQSAAAKAARVAAWRVPVLELGPAQAAVTLSALPIPTEGGEPPLVLAPDAQAWAAAGRWVLGLVARERAVPGLDAEKRSACWHAVLDDPRDQARLNAITAALPPAGRASADGESIPTARAALVDFIHRAVDDYLGGVAYDLTARPRIPDRWPDEARAWADALARGATTLANGIGPNTLRRFGAEVARWSEPLRGHAGAPPPFRTCFRLEPPAATKRRSRATDWTVEILLQAADDPSLLRAAGDAWSRSGGTSERLLADLGRAVRVFPTLTRALAEKKPSHLALQLQEASQFLRETAWLLEESGFGVFVPSERLVRGEDVRLKLRVRPKQERKTGSGLLGLQSIVDYDWEVSLGGQTLDADAFRALAQEKAALVEIRGQWVLLDPERVDRMLRTLQEQPADATLGDTLGWSIREGLPPVEIALEGTLAALSEPARLRELDPPGAFHGTLRPYQRRGFSWLAFLAERGLGSCLADDMGLGKTIQLLTLLLHRERKRPALLICPTSLVGNWQREAERFAPSLRVGVHHGADRRNKTGFARWAADRDVVLTTYALAARDEETLRTVEWDGIVLDEAQAVKNPDARQSRAVRALPGKWRVAMTGTPVENRLTDLWSLMDFLNPGLLGPRETFRRRFVQPVERYGDAARAAQLRAAVGPFVLRRLKTDPNVISDLPEKQEMKVYCPLTREQATLYQATLDDMLRKIEESDGVQRRGRVLATMLRLKQICDHPALFMDDGSPLHASRSGKQQRLEEMLEELVAAGDAALVFTQFASLGQLLSRRLAERLARRVLFLSGATPRRERDELVASFQAEGGPPVFVLSLKAGGVGLNLTRACHVFHFDRWWNPAVENQATDRAFRIGQKRNVQVHKFICQGTLEEAIDALIESKLALAEQVVGTGESWITELDTNRLRKLFTLQADAVEEDVP